MDWLRTTCRLMNNWFSFNFFGFFFLFIFGISGIKEMLIREQEHR